MQPLFYPNFLHTTNPHTLIINVNVESVPDWYAGSERNVFTQLITSLMSHVIQLLETSGTATSQTDVYVLPNSCLLYQYINYKLHNTSILTSNNIGFNGQCERLMCSLCPTVRYGRCLLFFLHPSPISQLK